MRKCASVLRSTKISTDTPSLNTHLSQEPLVEPTAILPFNADMQLLSKAIGAGKTNKNIRLHCGIVQGEGFYIRISLSSIENEQPAVWINRTAWKTCESALIGAANSDYIESELMAIIVGHALEPLLEKWPEVVIQTEMLIPHNLPARWAVVATITQPEYTLECALISWPATIILQQLPYWHTHSIAKKEQNAQFYILLGWCHLNRLILTQIQVGDGLAVSGVRTYTTGECWLWSPHGPLIAININEDNKEKKMNIEYILPNSETYWSEDGTLENDISNEEDLNS
ncbi:MAG: hypothetical protein ACRCVE_10180, partial [Plesiomonas sp.]